MVESMIDFYTSELTFFSLITKKNKYRKWISVMFGISFFLFILYLTIIYITSINKLQPSYLTLIVPITAILIVIVATFQGQKFNTNIIKENFPEVTIVNGKWNKTELAVIISNKLEEYITSDRISHQQLTKIQFLVEKKLEKEKRKSLLYFSVCAVLLLPLWTVFLNRFFDFHKTSIIELNFWFVIFFFLIISISLIRLSILDIQEHFLTRYNILESLNDLLNDLLVKNMKSNKW